MTPRRILFVSALTLVCSLSLATDELGEILLADLEGVQLSLEGSPHYYWLAPEHGRIALKKHCVPEPEDCDYEVFVVWDDDGTKLFDRAPTADLPGMKGNRVLSGTLLTPSRYAFSTVVQRDDWTHVLGQYNLKSGDLEYVVTTSPIRCRDLTGDTAGVLWCLGDHQGKRKNLEDYDLVYRFDHGGKLLDSTLPRSSFPEEPSPLGTVRTQSGYGGFLPGDGPIRLWFPDHGELVSFDEDGGVTARLDLPTVADQRHARLVSAPDDRVYALLTVGGDPKKPKTWTQALHHLASDGSQWVALHDPPITLPNRIQLIGADEKGLILIDRQSFKLLWYPYEAFEGQGAN